MGTHFLGISKFTARVSILRWSNLDLRVPIWGNPQNHTLEDGFGTWLGTLIFNDNDKHFVQLRYASPFIRLGKVLGDEHGRGKSDDGITTTTHTVESSPSPKQTWGCHFHPQMMDTTWKNDNWIQRTTPTAKTYLAKPGSRHKFPRLLLQTRDRMKLTYIITNRTELQSLAESLENWSNNNQTMGNTGKNVEIPKR